MFSLKSILVGTLFTESLALIVLGVLTGGVAVGIPMYETWGSNVAFDPQEIQTVAVRVLLVYGGVRTSISSVAALVRGSTALRVEGKPLP